MAETVQRAVLPELKERHLKRSSVSLGIKKGIISINIRSQDAVAMRASAMPGATVAQALSFLESRDYIFRDSENKIHVLDPLIKWVLMDGKSYLTEY